MFNIFTDFAFYYTFIMLLLVVEFFKHFLGSSLYIHTWFCNNGEACVKLLNPHKNYIANTLFLIRQSFYESIAFLIMGLIFRPLIENMYLFFTIGLILHIIAEKILIHKSFCKKSCDIIKPN